MAATSSTTIWSIACSKAMQAEARPIKPKALGPLGKDNVAATFERWGG